MNFVEVSRYLKQWSSEKAFSAAKGFITLEKSVNKSVSKLAELNMNLIEFLVANLGSAVAKSVLKFWARDSEFAQNAGGEILDFLKSKVSEGIA